MWAIGQYTIDVEAQVLRNGLPLTRPTRWSAGIESFEPGKLAHWKLFPGSANSGERVAVALKHMGYIKLLWVNVQATISVDDIVFPDRPGQIYVDADSMWPYGGQSCVINFPTMSHNTPFEGVFSLLLRTVVTRA